MSLSAVVEFRDKWLKPVAAGGICCWGGKAVKNWVWSIKIVGATP